MQLRHRVAVIEIFESAATSADVVAAYVRRSAEVLPWLIQIEADVRELVKYLVVGAAGGTTGATGATEWQV